MTFKPRTLALSAAAFFLSTFSVFAQVSALEGIVKDDAGQPVKGAKVKMDRKDIKGSYTSPTDKKGHYGHYGLPLGTYKVSVEIDGKVVDSVDNVKTRLGDPQTINFDLQNAKKEQQATQKALETGTLTKEQSQKMTTEQKAAFEKANKQRKAEIAKNKDLNDAYNAGKDALAAKQFDVAVTSLEKANTIDPKQNVIWAQLAEAYMGLAGTKTGAEGDAPRQKGLEAYAKAIELKPDDPSLYNNYALALVKAKKIDEAQSNLNKAAQLDPPGAVRYYYNLGAVLVNANQGAAAGDAFKKAIAAYDQAKAAGEPPADITKNYADSEYQLGVTMLEKASVDAKTGKTTPVPGTVEAFNRYLELQPTGQHAESAKGLLESIGGTVATNYKNPSATDSASKKKKGKQ